MLFRSRAYNYADICEAFLALGYDILTYEQDLDNYDEDSEFEALLANMIVEEACDMVFTVNYFALVTSVCEKTHVPYVVWTCDNPLISMYHKNVFCPCNYFFTFDKTNFLEFREMGVSHIWHLPLAVNTKRLDYLLGRFDDQALYENDIAFVGSLYQRNSYDSLLPSLPE